MSPIPLKIITGITVGLDLKKRHFKTSSKEFISYREKTDTIHIIGKQRKIPRAISGKLRDWETQTSVLLYCNAIYNC